MAGQKQQFVRRTSLGSEAVYQVVAEHGRLVELKVVSAPGLEPGTHVKVTRQAVKAMERLDESRVAPAPTLNLSRAHDLP